MATTSTAPGAVVRARREARAQPDSIRPILLPNVHTGLVGHKNMITDSLSVKETLLGIKLTMEHFPSTDHHLLRVPRGSTGWCLCSTSMVGDVLGCPTLGPT